MSIAIRETTGEAEYKTKQEFPSVEEAYQEKNPLGEIKTEVLEVRTINIKVKLKEVKYICDTINNIKN
jgi:hypothetical protein